jgi:hypothetical protein
MQAEIERSEELLLEKPLDMNKVPQASQPSTFRRVSEDSFPTEMIGIPPAASWLQPRFVPTVYQKAGWRKGKWLDEEEAYTKKLIEAFNAGYLNLPSGTTLRSFLSERLCWLVRHSFYFYEIIHMITKYYFL